MKRIKYMVPALFLAFSLAAAPVLAGKAGESAPAAPAKAGKEAATKSPAADSAKVVKDQAPGSDEQRQAEEMKQRAEAAKKQVVARVEGTEISMYDLISMMNRVVQAYYSHIQEPTPEITLEIKKKALDRLIFEELAVKDAVKQGISPTPESVQKVFDQLKETYKTPEEYQKYLKDLDITEEKLRERVTRSQRLEVITGREVYNKVKVPQEALQEAYEKAKKAGRLKTADKYKIKEILVMEGPDPKTTKATAEALLAKLKEQKNDFGKLMLDGTFIVRTYDVDKKRDPDLYTEMDKMKVDQMSGIFKDSKGAYHIFKVLEKEKSHDLKEEEARDFTEHELRMTYQEKRREEWKADLRKKGKVEILLDELKEDKTPAAEKKPDAKAAKGK